MAQAGAQRPWSIRSALISVTNLDRAVDFYTDVAGFSEVLREDQVVVLEHPGLPTAAIFLRQAYRNASHPSQQSLGVRTLSFEVSSLAELDKVEERLRAHDAFRDRNKVLESEAFEMVRGFDPDRLSLTFVADETGSPPGESHYRAALLRMYTLDL